MSVLHPLSLLRALVLGLGALVLCWQLTTGAGLVAAVLGTVCGTLFGVAAAPSRLRTGPLLAACALVGFGGAWLAGLLVRLGVVAGVLGPLRTRELGEVVLWTSLALAVAFALRLLAARFSGMVVVEMLAMAASIVGSVAAHRDGMIHRPLALADWAWSRGFDPMVLFLLLGAAAVLVLAALLMREERKRRLPLHLGALALLALLVLLLIHIKGVPEPRSAGDLGLTGQPRGGDKSGRGKPSPRPGQGQQDDLPFKNEYSSSGGDAPVAVVLLHADYAPPAGYFYFRQTAFSQYNGVRLVQSTRADVDQDVLDAFPTMRYDAPDPPPASPQRMELRTTIGLLADHPRPFALDALASLTPTANTDPMRFRRTYDAVSRVQTLPYDKMLGHQAGSLKWGDAEWQHYTEFPRADPRYQALADEIVGMLPANRRQDPLMRAVAVKFWLDKNGTYSRRSNHADEDDPTASFLFGDRIGYCVHFAHAACFLMRALGLPARVSGGYAVEESRRGNGSAILIRGRDGHAWPELYLRDVGWVVMDISPEKSLDPPEPDADTTLQRRLGESLREGSKERRAEVQRPPPVTARQAAGIGGLLLGLLLLVAYLIKLWRAVVPGVASPGQVYRVGYRAALDRLADVGMWRRRGETRERFAQRVTALSPSFVDLTPQHLAWALGSRRRPAPEAMRTLGARVFPELRLALPVWRWLLGLLNPISFLMAR